MIQHIPIHRTTGHYFWRYDPDTNIWLFHINIKVVGNSESRGLDKYLSDEVLDWLAEN